MQTTNSKLNTILLIILIILVGVGIYILTSKKNSNDQENSEVSQIQENSVTSSQEVPTGPFVDSNSYVPPQPLLKISPKFGLKYPNMLNINEYYRDISGKETDSISGAPYFFGTFGLNQDAVIAWGGYIGSIKATCSQSSYDAFQYGTSAVACIKGYRAAVGHFSARASVSQEDLNIFGDFVKANQ